MDCLKVNCPIWNSLFLLEGYMLVQAMPVEVMLV